MSDNTTELKQHPITRDELIEKMLEALKLARKKIEMWPEGSNPEYFPEIKAIDAAIARAEGK